MAKCILIKGGGGGISSEDVTVTKADIPVGLSAVTSDSNDEVVEGTFTLESELETQDDLISRISAALEGKASGSVSLQSKTVSPSLSKQTVTPDSGYSGLSNVVINAMPTATQATPSITVYSNGLINAVSTQTAGYVNAGTKNATKQLTTKGATTITPTKSSQTAVNSGVYTTGAITVGAIPSNYIVPSGTLNVTANGTHNVANYASVSVSVVGGGSGGLDESYCISAYNGSNLVRQVYCPNGDASSAMYSYKSKITNIVCGNNIVDIYNICYGCDNLTGSPVCGNNVANMARAYLKCSNLTGNPVCGNNVKDMDYAYYWCENLTGPPACGNNVTNMASAYSSCSNLTGPPVCGSNVTDMSSAYSSCSNLTGDFTCGSNVTKVYSCFYNSINIRGNHYFNNCSNITCARQLYYNRYNSARLNVYVNSNCFKYFNITNTYSIVGKNITWSNTNTTCYYNKTYNIYLYKV